MLKHINSPSDIKRLPRSELPRLASEIRSVIVNTVSKNGGHLSSNLGVVELTIALYYVFDCPNDKIIWDVGHQSYTHMLLTGRRDRFHTLRRLGGIPGFPRICESPYDAFSTGHSSTSISAGLGISCANELNNHPGKVVSVIGDGSMTAGLAYEALNQAGALKKDLIVILNDNDMSIAPNVGALSSLLSRTFSAKYLQDIRKEIGELLRSLPGIGNDAYQFAKRAEESFKAFVTPGILFEAFDFDYFGPIKGHRIDRLIDILNNIKMLNEPVLLHITTTKGKGYAPAEKNPTYFHGIGSFDVGTGRAVASGPKTPTYTKVFGDTMINMAQKDEKIVVITAAMPEGTGLSRFSEIFPKRFFDVGIAEPHGVTFAAGMATQGLKPVVAIYSTFLQRAYDQIIHDVCLDRLPVVFAIDRGGIAGEDGPTHHGIFDLTYMRSIPNMVVMAPKDENELARMLATAMAIDGPAAVRYPRGKGPGTPVELPAEPLPVGVAELLTGGSDILIICIGSMVAEGLEAAKKLSREFSINASVVNARFVKPLDADLIPMLARKIPNIITVEDNVLHGGFGSAVLELLGDAGVSDCRVIRLGINDTYVGHGPKEALRALHGINADAIVKAAKRFK